MHLRFTSVLATGLLIGSFALANAANTTTTTSSASSTTTTQGPQGGPHGQGGPQGGGLREACQDDDEKVCPGVLAAHQDIVACLKKNIASVSATCREALEKMPAGGQPPQGGQGGPNGQQGGTPPAPPSGNAN